MRAPIYVTNEAIEMELGVKKITDLYNKSLITSIGKMYTEKDSLHYNLIKQAIELRTQTIRNWRGTMRRTGIAEFNDIDNMSQGNLDTWKKLVRKNSETRIIDAAKKRTIYDKEFPTMKLFWTLSEGYKHTIQAYIRLNKHRVDEIRYIFKLRTGCDGSRETLAMRHLLDVNETNCHVCH